VIGAETARLTWPGEDWRLVVGALRILAALVLADDDDATAAMRSAASASAAFELFKAADAHGGPEAQRQSQLRALSAHSHAGSVGRLDAAAAKPPSREQLAIGVAARAFMATLWTHERRALAAHPLLTQEMRAADPSVRAA
jgi:hypothetical protein